MLSSTPATSPSSTTAIFEKIIRKRGRECPRCGGRHRDTVFKMCQPCRDIAAAYHKAYRHDHIARKLCPECVQKKGKITINCEYHREYANTHNRERAHDQRAKGLCAWGRCPNAAPDTYFCDEHRAKANEWQSARKDRRNKRPWRLSA